MPKHGKTVNISKFRGIENKSLPENTSPEFLKKAINIDITKNGDVIKRSGYSKIIDGINLHSLWSDGTYCFFVENGSLYKLNNDLSKDLLDNNIGNNRVSYHKLNDIIYYTCPSSNGIIRDGIRENLGIDPPQTTFSLSEGVGNLYEGQYQITISYVTEDGRESGSFLPKAIDVSGNSSIIINNIPQSADPSVESVRIYMSVVNGGNTYIAQDIPNGQSSTIIYNERDLVTPNETLGVTPPPDGNFISSYNGSLLIAVENILYWSEPFTPDWFFMPNNFYQFESNITFIIPMNSGIYIGLEDRVVWLSGNNINDMSLTEKELCHPVRFSEVEIPSGYIVIDNTPLGPKWLFTSDEGIFVCMENGVMFNVTSSNISLPSSEEGSSLFMQENGVNKYISLLKNKNSDSQNMAVGDVVTAEVIRNGVVIP